MRAARGFILLFLIVFVWLSDGRPSTKYDALLRDGNISENKVDISPFGNRLKRSSQDPMGTKVVGIDEGELVSDRDSSYFQYEHGTEVEVASSEYEDKLKKEVNENEESPDFEDLTTKAEDNANVKKEPVANEDNVEIKEDHNSAHEHTTESVSGGHYTVYGVDAVSDHHDMTRLKSVTVDHSITDQHHAARFPIIVSDFGRVGVPFVICMWIFLAAMGKIGKYLFMHV